MELRKIAPPTRAERWIVRTLVALGLLAMALFIWWFADPDHVGAQPLYFLLTFALGFRFLRLLHEWYHYLGISVPEMPASTREWKVDMVTTFCPGEPYEMIIDTLRAMKAVTYSHETYLCDEGNDPYMRQVCEELGVHHVYRGPEKKNAKAGNVNYCLEHHARGEIVVVMDPDHLPVPEFLDRVLPYFEDPRIGFVQCVQAYYNRDESFIAKAAAEQTYHFYGPMMMSMNTYGTAQAIGANCTFRRAALDSIGGHAPGLSEDMHTAMRLHAKGWKSLYVPEALSRGLVPASLSGFYKQQLKWTRGSLDLLVKVVPGLFRNLTWRQTLHYVTIPLYFLYGLIAVIDLGVPLAALVRAEAPWQVELGDLLLYAAPLICLTVIIRQFSQRWLLEEHERGFHLFGGAMLMGTWWIFLTGLVYTLLNVKVPYIPTPKDDKPANEWKLSLPNIFMILFSLAVIAYGLKLDWSPYSLLMASFAGLNVVFLTLVVVISQRKLIHRFYSSLYGGALDKLRVRWFFLLHKLVYKPLRNVLISSSLVILVFVLSAFLLSRGYRFDPNELEFPDVIPSEGFYVGVWNPADPEAVRGADMASVFWPWREDSSGWFPAGVASGWEKKGTLPYLVWEMNDSLVMEEVLAGKWDAYIKTSAEAVFAHQGPVMLALPVPKAETQAALYGRAFTYLAKFFQREGVANANWVWHLQHDLREPLYAFPQNNKARYIALRAPEGIREPQRWYRSQLKGLPSQLPVLLVGAMDPNAFSSLLADFPMIQGWMALPGDTRRGLAEKVIRSRGEGYEKPAFLPSRKAGSQPEKSKNPYFGYFPVEGFSWVVNGKPFYIRGVAYNPAHDWHDGKTPLVQSVLDRDMVAIKEMGANTIRRYSPGIYDYNILKEAEDHDLKVIYGFWFDPKIDYYTDSAAVSAYRKEVVQRVKKFQDHPAVIAWGVGNETWGILKHYHRPAYLVRVRQAYLEMLEAMARDIQAIDGSRPVFTAMEHSRDLSGELRAVRRAVPSIDFVGVNSYFEMQVRQLDSLCTRFFPEKPYLVSEFGPEGYWDEDYTDIDEFGHPKEPGDFAKAQNYIRHWREYVEGNRERNLGGVAFCWKDRMEETITWFGLTDHKNRKKPSYFALRSAWTGEPFEFPMHEIYLSHPWQLTGDVEIKLISPMLDSLPSGLTYEWSIREDNILRPLNTFEVLSNGRKIKVDFSTLRPGRAYRAYLHLHNQGGEVVTATVPLLVNPDFQYE